MTDNFDLNKLLTPNQDNLGEFYTHKELAQKFKLSESYIRRLARAKKIPYYRFGRLLRFKKDDIEKWLANGGNSDTVHCVIIPSVHLEKKEEKKGEKHGRKKQTT